MPNNIVTVKQIARETLPRLISNLVFPRLINQDFNEMFSQKKGDKIQVRKPVILNAKDFDASIGVTAQDVNEESVEVALDKIASVDIEVGALEGATTFDDITRLFIEPSGVALADMINADGLKLYKDIPYAYGTAGTAPSAVTDFTNIRKIMNKNKVPTSNRRFVFDPDAEANFLALDKFSDADRSGSTQALREASLGRLYGFDNFMAQDIQSHTKGTLATAGTSGKKILLKGAANGATQITLDTDDTALTGTLVKGDLLNIGGKTVTVTENTSAAANEITVKIYPALTAADNTPAMVTDSHMANLAFNPSAFTFVNRPLIQPSGVESYVVNHDGISLRVVKGYDMKYKKEMLSMDVLYGYTTTYPELAVRVLG